MKKSSPLGTGLTVLALVFVAVAAVANVAFLFIEQPSALHWAFACVTELALIAAFIYLLKGATKAQAGFYKAFLGLFCLSELTVVAQYAGMENMVAMTCLNAICFAIVAVMFFGHDLGEARSLIFSVILLGIRTIGTLWTLSELLVDGRATGVRFFAELLIALVYCVCTFVKYLDKETRHPLEEEV